MNGQRRKLICRITIYTLLIMLCAGFLYVIRLLIQNSRTDSQSYEAAEEGNLVDPGNSAGIPDTEVGQSLQSQQGQDVLSPADRTVSSVPPDESTDPDAEPSPDRQTEPPASSQDTAPPEQVPDPSRPMVALTFDDGPGRGTSAILDLLEQYDAKATFFVLGLCLEQPAQVEKMQRAYDMGCVIGSHTYDHISFKKLDKDQVRDQIDRTNELLQQYIGCSASLIRPPYGHVTQEAREAADAPFIHWSIDTNDWLSRDAQSVIEAVQESVQDGDIILMHDIYPSTAQACETLIPWLIDQGYQLVTVPELMEAKGIVMENGQSYNSAK